jgi:hypothetical protein
MGGADAGVKGDALTDSQQTTVQQSHGSATARDAWGEKTLLQLIQAIVDTHDGVASFNGCGFFSEVSPRAITIWEFFFRVKSIKPATRRPLLS